MKIKVLPAYNGDSILISYPIDTCKESHILVDGGIARTYPKSLKDILQEIKDKNEEIELLVITHVDDDHIGGIIKLFEDVDFDTSIIKNIWFNSGSNLSGYFNTPIDNNRDYDIIPSDIVDMSTTQGETLEGLLIKHGGWDRDIIKEGTKYKSKNIEIIVLTPDNKHLERLNKKWEKETDLDVDMSNNDHRDHDILLEKLCVNKFKEDKSVPNGSSISLLVKCQKKKILLLADSYPSLIISGLESSKEEFVDGRIKIDLVKIAHHGSRKNTNDDLLEILDCDKYIISTDGQKHGLPDKESMARIIANNPNCKIYFNYDNEITQNIFSSNDKEMYPDFKTRYLTDDDYNITLK